MTDVATAINEYKRRKDLGKLYLMEIFNALKVEKTLLRVKISYM